MFAGEQTVMEAGVRSVWRHQGIVCLFFAVNLLLAFLAAKPISSPLHSQLDYSFYSERLSSRFDANALTELLYNSSSLMDFGQSSAMTSALLYGLFALFATGGTLTAYRARVRLTVGDFFQSCGTHFFRLLRLLLCFLGVLVLVIVILSPLLMLAASLLSRAMQQHIGFALGIFGIVVLLLCCMVLRLWFDISQIEAVADGQCSILRCVGKSFVLTFRNFGTLFWMYLRISMLNWLTILGAILVWIHLPATSWKSTLALWEVVALFSITARLWQRASEVAWYHGMKERALAATS